MVIIIIIIQGCKKTTHTSIFYLRYTDNSLSTDISVNDENMDP